MNEFDKNLFGEVHGDIPEEAFGFFREGNYFHGFRVAYYKSLEGFLRKYFTGNPKKIFLDKEVKDLFVYFLKNMNIFYEFVQSHSTNTSHQNLDFRKRNHPVHGGPYHDLKEEQEVERLGTEMLTSYKNFFLRSQTKLPGSDGASIKGLKEKKDVRVNIIIDKEKGVYDKDNPEMIYKTRFVQNGEKSKRFLILERLKEREDLSIEEASKITGQEKEVVRKEIKEINKIFRKSTSQAENIIVPSTMGYRFNKDIYSIIFKNF